MKALYRTRIGDTWVYVESTGSDHLCCIRNNSEQCECCGREVRLIVTRGGEPVRMVCAGSGDYLDKEDRGCGAEYRLEYVGEDKEEQ